MVKDKRYTDDDFIDAVKNSISMAQVFIKLGLQPTGGNYIIANRRMKNLGLDFSHFLGKGHNKGKKINKKSKSLEEIMIENSSYTDTNKLKKRLIKEGIFEYKCYNCNNTSWLDKPIPLELEHKNGNRFDNRIENLTLLCPNCHSFTPTYRGRGKKVNRALYIRPKKCFYCKNCGIEITRHSKNELCIKCFNISNRKVKERPSKEILLKEIEETNYCAVARKYGVTDNAIRKWLK